MNKKKSIVITGASSGLGECLNKSFSKSYNVVNISRTIATSKYNILVNLRDLSDLKQKLEKQKFKRSTRTFFHASEQRHDEKIRFRLW